MRNILTFIFFGLTLCWVSQHKANSQTYNLKSLIELALSNNLQIQSATLDTKLSKERIKQVQANLMPQVNISGNYTYYYDVPTQLVPASALGGPEDSYLAAELGVPVNINANIRASQVIFNSQLLVHLKIAKIANESSTIQLNKTKEDIVYNVSASYYNLKTIIAQQQLINKRIENVNSLISKVRILEQNGLVKKIDLDRLLVLKTNLDTKLTEISETETKLINLLKVLCSLNYNDNLEIDPTISVSDNVFIPTLDTIAYQNRFEYQMLAAQNTILQLEHKSIKSSCLPTLSAIGQFGYNGYNSTFEGLKAYNSKYFEVSSIGLSLHIPVFSGFSKMSQSRYKLAEIQRNKLQQDLFRRNTISEISNAIQSYNTALNNLSLQFQNKDLSNQNYDQVALNYKEGLIGVSDLINADNELKEAETNYLSAYIKLKIAELNYKKLTNNMIDNAN